MVYYSRSGGNHATQCTFWESLVGMFWNWPPFKTPTPGQTLQLNMRGAWKLQYFLPNLLYMIRSLPAGPDRAFGLQNICPLDYCKAAARFNAQRWVSSKRFPPTSTAVILNVGGCTRITAESPCHTLFRHKWLNSNKSLWLAEPKHVIRLQLKVFTQLVMTDPFTCYTKYTSNRLYLH